MSDPHTMEAESAATFEAVEKSFFGVKVLKGITLATRAGRVLGLVGENGAGKSTLMNLLGGNLRPDAGRMRVGGRPYAPRHPNDARAAGIAFVHQELNLFPNLSIAENLHLANFPRRGGWPWIDHRRLRQKTETLLQEVGLERDAETPVERLPAGERQLVEFAKALGAEARVLILDEPTTSLSVRECERLFALVGRLRERGLAIICISHALGDVLRLCDDVAVLRDGELVGAGPAESFTPEKLITLMVGRQLTRLYPERAAASLPEGGGRPLLEVRGLSQPGVVRDIRFEVARGEVLGLFGLMGAGRSDLARILFGLDPHTRGEVRLDGDVLRGGPRERIRQGLAFLTEDRRLEGLCLSGSIAENLTLAALPKLTRTWAGWVDGNRRATAVARMRDAVRLSASTADRAAVQTLSGGNQQKVVLGKWLMAEPKALILDEPTRGIDVGAKFEIYQLIHQLAERGAGVLAISSELEELTGICDRLLVMRRGEIVAEFPRGAFDRERILAAALHTAQA